MSGFYKRLQEIELAESRISPLFEATNKLHSAISKLDDYNLALIKKHFPEFIAVAETFGKYDQFSNSNFEVTERLAVQGEIDAEELFGGDV